MAFASSPRIPEGLLGLQWVFCHHGKQPAVLPCVFLLQISALISASLHYCLHTDGRAHASVFLFTAFSAGPSGSTVHDICDQQRVWP